MRQHEAACRRVRPADGSECAAGRAQQIISTCYYCIHVALSNHFQRPPDGDAPPVFPLAAHAQGLTRALVRARQLGADCCSCDPRCRKGAPGLCCAAPLSSSACGSRAAPYRPKGAASDGFAGADGSASYVRLKSFTRYSTFCVRIACLPIASHRIALLHHRLADCHARQESKKHPASRPSPARTSFNADLYSVTRAKEGPNTSKCEHPSSPSSDHQTASTLCRQARRQARNNPRGVKCLMSNRADGAAGKRRRWLRRSARGVVAQKGCI